MKEEMKDVSRIEKAIEQGNPPKFDTEALLQTNLRWKDAPLSKKIKPSVMDICDISAMNFNCLGRKENHEMFSLSLKEIDRYLGETPTEPKTEIQSATEFSRHSSHE